MKLTSGLGPVPLSFKNVFWSLCRQSLTRTASGSLAKAEHSKSASHAENVKDTKHARSSSFLGFLAAGGEAARLLGPASSSSSPSASAAPSSSDSTSALLLAPLRLPAALRLTESASLSFLAEALVRTLGFDSDSRLRFL